MVSESLQKADYHLGVTSRPSALEDFMQNIITLDSDSEQLHLKIYEAIFGEKTSHAKFQGCTLKKNLS